MGINPTFSENVGDIVSLLYQHLFKSLNPSFLLGSSDEVYGETGNPRCSKKDNSHILMFLTFATSMSELITPRDQEAQKTNVLS